MFDKMKQLMELKQQADRIKKELEGMTVEVNEVQGIKIVVNGVQRLRSIEIDEGLLEKGQKQRIEEGLLRSVNAAVKESQTIAAQKMSALMPGLS
jgi:DNA-binding protein YbaB